MANEHKAYAAVRIGPRGGVNIVSATARDTDKYAQLTAEHHWGKEWDEAKRHGWRIRPVIIRLEEREQ